MAETTAATPAATAPESRDSSVTRGTSAPARSSIPPEVLQPKHKTVSPVRHKGVSSSSFPSMSPRVAKDRNSSLKGLLGTSLGGSPRHVPQRDRAYSLGQYPASFSGSNNLFMPPYSPMPPPSPVQSATEGPPFVPNLSPSHPTQAAREAAVHKERVRAKEKEKEEEHMSADELRAVLKRERNRMSKMAADLAALKSTAVQSQAEAEVCEEGRINCLMRRVESLQQEKGRIIIELEREEEMLTNTLQKKLDQVKKEKAVLEAQIEREQTSHTDLKSKLTSIRGANETEND